MASTSSSAQKRSSTSAKLYDAFINHRGSVVTDTLSKQLYELLEERGCRVVLECEEIEEESFPSAIHNVICSTLVQITIFSKRFAESARCLDELVIMLEQEPDALFIPVFYDVQPWELRSTERGEYAVAFSCYQNNAKYFHKVDVWKKALASAASKPGYEHSQYQSNLCAEIVSRVLQEMKRRKSLHVAKYPVGLAELVQDFEISCSKREGMVGIFGPGGSGKTTMVKELFKRKRSRYRASCFLSDVRESHAKSDLKSLQSQLVQDLFDEKHFFRSEEDGIALMMDRLERSRDPQFLIVLDDVDHQDQLDILLPKGKWGSGSLVIITARDQSLLMVKNIRNYWMKGLYKDHAKELFLAHAFRGGDPPNGFVNLIEGFLKICGGSPLLLKVLGAHVYCRDEYYWESTLEKAKKIQDKNVMQILKISFDDLDREEKQIFIDIACFFHKKMTIEVKSMAISIWKVFGWRAENAVQTLQDKSLLEVRGGYPFQHFKMHDHLRDLGRQMADDMGPPRLWRPHILRSMKIKGFKQILAETKGRCFDSFRDSTLKSKVTYFMAGLNGSAEAELLWLDIDNEGGNLKNFPSWIPLRKLHGLTVRKLEDFWKTFQQPSPTNTQLAFQLRELRITKCYRVSSLPEEFCALQSLEHFELSCCPKLSSLPPRFGDLRNLRYLDLSNCDQLEELPESFEQLICLKYIRLSCCWKLKLRLDMLKNITRLEYLELTRCHELEEIPRLETELRELRITHCFRVNSLPEEFCALQSLEHLELSCCPMLSSLPPRFGDLISLRYLDLSCCWKLKLKLDMLKNMTKLEYLDLTRCHELEELPHQITNQAYLTRLFVEGTSIRDLPNNIGELFNMKELRIGSPILTSLPSSLGYLSCLTSLLIDGCVQVKYLPSSFCRLDLLKQLKIRASGLRELPFRATSSRFGPSTAEPRSLEITEPGSLEIDFRNKLPASLEILTLVANPQLIEIRILPQSLTILEICACKMLKNVSGIAGLVKLGRLEICSCPELDEIPNFAGLASLQELKIQGCPKVDTIQGLGHCTSLQILTAELPIVLTCEPAISDFICLILSMKKCPLEMMVRGRVIHPLKPILDSFSLENLSVLLLEKDSDWKSLTPDLFNGPFVWYEEEKASDNEGSKSSGEYTPASKILHIGVCREGSSAFPEYCVGRRVGSSPNVKQRKAMLAVGEDERVVAAFYELIRLLKYSIKIKKNKKKLD